MTEVELCVCYLLLLLVFHSLYVCLHGVRNVCRVLRALLCTELCRERDGKSESWHWWRGERRWALGVTNEALSSQDLSHHLSLPSSDSNYCSSSSLSPNSPSSTLSRFSTDIQHSSFFMLCLGKLFILFKVPRTYVPHSYPLLVEVNIYLESKPCYLSILWCVCVFCNII